MKILVLHNAPGNDLIDAMDVASQRDALLTALHTLGFESRSASCTLDLDAVRREVQDYQPDVVFNLVESLAGTDRLMSLVPLLLDAMHVPYTGANSAAVLATGNKVLAKRQLRQFGLPTPEWRTRSEASKVAVACNSRWIIKPLWEHASLGMDDDSVCVFRNEEELDERLLRVEQGAGRPMLAESYIEGREFNLSLLAGDVLPPAEIDFGAFPVGKPRIVGYAAKWDADSFEYQQTPRRFDFPSTDQALLDSLGNLSRQCWKSFGLTGFARVDFRVDAAGQPWILEVNVNPCLSPDAGFAAALSEAGICFEHAIGLIIDDALNAAGQTASKSTDKA